jgi:hypothetical protein
LCVLVSGAAGALVSGADEVVAGDVDCAGADWVVVGIPESKTEVLDLDPDQVKKTEVAMKRMASPKVSFWKKLIPPEAPNTD